MDVKPITVAQDYPWEGSNLIPSLIGFANRDAHNTEKTTSTPRNMRMYGEPLQKILKPYNSTRPLTIDSSANSQPLFVQFEMAHVYAAVKTEGAPPEDPFGERIDHSAFQDVTRDLKYTVKLPSLNFEVIDVQWAQCVLEEIAAQLSALFRGCDAWAWKDSADNQGLAKTEYLMNAVGFANGLGSGSEAPRSSGSGYNDLIAYINQYIIGRLNNYYWFWDLFPNTWRKAALYSGIFQEFNSEDFACGNYVFVPRVVYMPGMNGQNSTFMMTPETPADTLWGRAAQLYRMIEFLVENDSFDAIQIAFKSISRTRETLLDDIPFKKNYFAMYPYYGRPISFYYQPAILLAIHNMSILEGLRQSPVECVIGSGDKPNQLVQTFSLPDPSSATAGLDLIRYTLTNAVASMPAIIDTPEYITADDWQKLIFLTQWTVRTFPEQPTNEFMLSPKVLGLEVCGGCSIYAAGVVGSSSTYTRVQLNKFFATNHFGISNQANYTTDGGNLYVMGLISQMNCFPITPLIYYATTGSGSSITVSKAYLNGFLTDTTYLSSLSFNALQDIKEQLWYNAYSFPLLVKEGSYDGVSELTNSFVSRFSSNEAINREDSTTQGGESQQSSGPSATTRSPRSKNDWASKNKSKKGAGDHVAKIDKVVGLGEDSQAST